MNEQLKSLVDALSQAANAPQATSKALTVQREGTKIILPERMTYRDAINVLEKKMDEDNMDVSIHEVIETHPFDGAYALMQVLQQIYGWPTAAPVPGFFGPRPPVLKDVDIDYKKKSQVIWGGFSVPGIKGQLQTGIAMSDTGRRVFCLQGTVKQIHKDEVKAIADEVRKYVAEKSVYKGKAVLLKTTEEGEMDMNVPPQFFLDVTRVKEEELTFSDEVDNQIRVNLFTPIEKTEQCRAAKIPLKRGILLEGPYGTGKTLTAYVTAKKCLENKWTFIYLDRVTGIKEALIFARQYAPAVVFSEDIDRALDGARDMSVDDILNTIDGVDSKNQDIITILTTNHVDRIEKAMLRPGRLDAVISVQAPDQKAATKLMRTYGGTLIQETEDLSAAAKELAGQIPAVIREVIERAKLYAISRLQPGEELKLAGKDILASAISMKHHLSLMKPVPTKKPDEQIFGETLVSLMSRGLSDTLNGTKEKIAEVHAEVCQ